MSQAHCCSAIDGKLYAVGGRNAAGELSTVECYTPQNDEWNFVEKMQEPHYGHAGEPSNAEGMQDDGICSYLSAFALSF